MNLLDKKANHGDNIDRISDLPSNVIDGILEHLNIRDVVRTSILSRRWRYMWISVPQLEFDEDFFDRYMHLDDPGSEISRIITEVLLLHHGLVYKFTLLIPFDFNFAITIEYLNKWILFLSRKGIKYLKLVNLGTIPDQIPYHVFSCHELTYLELGGFNLSIPPSFCGFKSLLDLHLQYMEFEFSALESLISGCPLLEKLSISFCDGFECFDFSAPTLKVLHIEFDEDIKSICLEKAKNLIDLTLMADGVSVSGLIKSLPKIQRLALGSWWCNETLYADIIPPTLLISSFSSLEYLKLNAVNLNERGELLYIVSVLQSASNLVELVVKSSSHVGTTQVSDHSEELECSSCCLGQLQTVTIGVEASCQHAMSLIRFILANSPSLDILTLYAFGLGSKQSDASMLFSISRDLLRMKRASQKAAVEFLHR